MSEHRVNYFSFISAEQPLLWEKYQSGLKDVLIHFGVDRVILSTAPQQLSKDTYAVIALNKNGLVMGGIRLEIKSNENKIPLEKIEHQIRSQLILKIRSESELNKSKGRLGEVCGLWVSREAKGMGLGAELAFQATKLATELKLSTIISMLPTHTLNYFLSLGYQPDSELPKISYPDDRYVSTVVWYYVPELFLRSEKPADKPTDKLEEQQF